LDEARLIWQTDSERVSGIVCKRDTV